MAVAAAQARARARHLVSHLIAFGPEAFDGIVRAMPSSRRRGGTLAAADEQVALDRNRRSEKVSTTIAREIVEDVRGLPAGSRLPPEPQLAQRYGVARSTIRESLRILELQGLLSIRVGPGGGPTVTAVDSGDFARMTSLHYQLADGSYRHIVEARMALEPVITRLAASRRDRAQNELLEKFLANDLDAEELPVFLDRTTGFHSLLLSMSGNPVLDLIGQSLQDVYLDRLEGSIFPSCARGPVEADHEEIARAVIDGNADLAERLMRDHLVHFPLLIAETNPGVLEERVRWL